MQLSPVIGIDEEKCVNCYKCVLVCPVKFCMDASGDTVSILHNRCIGCGSCIDACDHDARYPIDDWESFNTAVRNRTKMVAIVAPSAAASFSDSLLKINGMLSDFGVEAFFDVSFGAELTVKSYIEYIKRDAPKTVIAQPCPAVVSYIEMYKPELLSYLAPADSPMLHTVKMIREYYPKYRNHRIVVISPCLAKRREFDDTSFDALNVTFLSIEKYLKEQGKTLEDYPEVAFTSPDAERAVLFSTPGGLLATLERDAPEVAAGVRKIEGPEVLYPYLAELPGSIEAGTAPTLVDCLSCERGCNGGTGTSVRKDSWDLLDYRVKLRSEKAREAYSATGVPKRDSRKVDAVLRKYWKPGLYDRAYTDRSGEVRLQIPTEKQKWEIFHSMEKYSEADVYNCSSCGYNTCEDMAVAIFNGLNKRENCHHYQLALMEKIRLNTQSISARLHNEIANTGTEVIQRTSCLVEELLRGTEVQASAIEQSSAIIEELVASIQNVSVISSARKSEIDSFINEASGGIHELNRTVQGVRNILDKVSGIQEMSSLIANVSSNTNLLAMNAAIEAAHAGEAGRGFAVVAGEIRKLAETSSRHVQGITQNLKNITQQVQDTATISEGAGENLKVMIDQFKGMAGSFVELIASMEEMSEGSSVINDSLGAITENSRDVQGFCRRMEDISIELQDLFSSIHGISEENLQAFKN